jgi:hypothetical protein
MEKATQREIPQLSLSRYLCPNQPLLPGLDTDETQPGTPGLLLSSPETALFDENPAQTTISYIYDSLYRLTDAVYFPSTGSGGFEFHYTYDPVGNRLTRTIYAKFLDELSHSYWRIPNMPGWVLVAFSR